MSAQVLGGENGIRKGNAQITFPAVFSATVAAHGPQYGYAPQMGARPLAIPAGEDFQAQWHDQKRKDAHAMAMAKVQSTRNARMRSFTSAHNVPDAPHPSLVQRQFANPSLGAYGNHSARQDGTSAPFQLVEGGAMTGGVLRSITGREYAKSVLERRIQSLNAIAAAKQEFLADMPGTQVPTNDMRAAPTELPGTAGEATLIELNLLLQSIDDALEGGADGLDGLHLNRLNYADALRALTIIFRVAPRADVGELAQVLGRVENILVELIAINDPDANTYEADKTTAATAISMADLFDRVVKYLREMVGKANLSPKDRLALSKNLVRSLDFAGLRRGLPREVELRRDLEDLDDGVEFDDNAPRREDTEHGTTTTSSSSADGGAPRRGLPVRNPRDGLSRREQDAFGAQLAPGARPAARYIDGAEALPDGGEPQFGREAPVRRVVRAVLPRTPSLASRFDPDTQAFNVDTGRRPGAAARASRAATSEGEEDVEAAPAVAAAGLPTTAAELRDQTRTMADVRALAQRMRDAGIAYAPRETTSNVDHARKRIAVKLGIRGRY
jgi:hypothetical protein